MGWFHFRFLVFKAKNHIQRSGYENPDWCEICLMLENELLTYNCGNTIPQDPDQIEVCGAKRDLVERVHKEIENTGAFRNC